MIIELFVLSINFDGVHHTVGVTCTKANLYFLHFLECLVYISSYKLIDAM